MLNVTKFKQATLVRIGFGAFALSNVGRYVVDHTGRSNDVTDFVFGAIMGIGFGVLALYAFFYGRNGRPNPPGASAC